MKSFLQSVTTIFFTIVVSILVFSGCEFVKSLNTSPYAGTNPSVPLPTTSVVPSTTLTPVPEPVPKTMVSTEIVNMPTDVGGLNQSEEIVDIKYSWTYLGEWTWQLRIPLSLYNYFQQLPRPPTENYSIYVTHPMDDIYLDQLVQELKNAAQGKSFSRYQTVEFAASFVQSLPYTTDSVTTPFDEYPRYPIETLVDNGGDCEDTSILLASILDRMGYGTVMLMLPNHVAIGVKGENLTGSYWDYNGAKYYYLETTGQNWGIGNIPAEYINTSARIYSLTPVPILTHDGSINSNGYVAEVEVLVSNIGTAIANNVIVFAGFDTGENTVWNSQESEPFALGVNQQATIKLIMNVPFNVHTRLIVQILMENVVTDESYTDWFDT